MKSARRTLVKSPPEVWEALDHPERMEGLMSALVGHAAEIEVYERVEESKLAWKSPDGRIEISLAEKGWGTNVSVSAENGQEPTKLEGWLDAVLEELATPQKRPFGGMAEAPAGTLAEAFSSKPKPEEPPKPPPAEETEAESKVAEVAQVEAEAEQSELQPEPQPEPQPEVEQVPAPRPKKRGGFFSRFF
jgi:hypothetical protein